MACLPCTGSHRSSLWGHQQRPLNLRCQLLQEEQLEGVTNEDLLQAIWRINSLQRSLSIMALTWASCLHDAAAAAFPGKLRPGITTTVSMQGWPSGAPTGSLLQV